MRATTSAVAVAALAAAAFLAGRRPAETVIVPRPVRTDAPLLRIAPVAGPDPAPAAIADSPRPALANALERADWTDLAKLEEELEARLIEDRAFARVLFDAFRIESDPLRMSFLANVLASDPPIRNSPAWQNEFMQVAEHDVSFERRAAALLFLQQTETLRPVMDRLLTLAESDRELCPNALAALKGLPESRRPDPRVADLAGRIADRDPDPTLRGIALRIEENPVHAMRFLSDPDRTVRMQASRVATSREALSAALRAESDEEVREMFQARLEELK